MPIIACKMYATMISLKLYLDKRHLKGNEERPATVKVVITKKRSTALISSMVSVLPTQWNHRDQKVVNHPNEKRLNLFISKFLISIQNIVLDIEEEGLAAGMNATQIKDYIVKKLNPIEENPKVYYHEWAKKFIDTKDNERTKHIHTATLSRVRHFCKNWESLTFEEMDRKWLIEFERFMAQTSRSANGRAVHLRNIRTVFNYAISEEAITVYPFKKFKIKLEETIKRSFSVSQLRNIYSLSSKKKHLREGADIFMLIFMLRGINFFDLFNLKHSNIINGRIEYMRSKTKKLYSVKIEPEAAKIIELYKGEKHLLNFADRFNTEHNALQQLNLKIKQVIEKCNEKENKVSDCSRVTTYWARHSWATIASELDIPKETIAAGLGHNIGSPITSIYIDFNLKKVDEANRRIIDYILYNKV